MSSPTDSISQDRAKAVVASGYHCGHCGYSHTPPTETIAAIESLIQAARTEARQQALKEVTFALEDADIGPASIWPWVKNQLDKELS